MDLKSISHFFTENPNQKFNIPIYQRGYSWTAEKIEDLFTDLDEIEQDESSYHFLGLVVYTTSKKLTFDVIDGQQRITTITLILNCIQDLIMDIFKEDPKYSAQKKYRNLLVEIETILFDKTNEERRLKTSNENKREDELLNILIYSLDSKDRIDWEREIINESFFNAREKILNHPKSDWDKRSLRFKNAYKAHIFIKKYLTERYLNQSLDNDNKLNKLHSLVNSILHKTKIIPFQTASESEAFKLFEVLNDRGIAVSSVDLLKNVCLKNGTNEKQIEDIHNAWKEVFQIELQTDNYIFFLRTSHNSRYDFITKNQLFEGFSAKIKNLDYSKTVSFLSDDLLVDSKYFNLSTGVNQTKDKNINSLIQILNTTGSKQHHTITLSALRVLSVSDSLNVYKKLMEILSSTLEIILSMIINGERFNKIEKVFPLIAANIKSYTDEQTVLNVLDNTIYKLTELKDKNDLFNYSSVKFDEIDFSSGNKLMSIFIMLYKYSIGSSLSKDYIELEHICPQKKSSHPYWKNFPQERVFSIGNGLLTNRKSNSSLSNKSFPEKKLIYKELFVEDHIDDSKLKINNLDDWSLETVNSREENIKQKLSDYYGFNF